MGSAAKKLHKFLRDIRQDAGLTQEKLSELFFDLDAMHAVGDSRISDIERKELPSYGLARLYDHHFGTGDKVRELTKDALLERHGFTNGNNTTGGFRFTAELTAITIASTRYPLDENLLITPSPDRLWLPLFRHLKPISIIRPATGDDVSFVFDFGVTVTHHRRTQVFDSIRELGEWRETGQAGRYLCVNLVGHYWTRSQLPAALRLLATPKTVSRRNDRDGGVDVDLTDSFEKRSIGDDLHPPGTTDFSVEHFFYGAATATSYAVTHLDSSTVDDNEIVSYVSQLQAAKYVANRAVQTSNNDDVDNLRRLRLALSKPLQKGRQLTHIVGPVKQASEIGTVLDHAIGYLELGQHPDRTGLHT